MGGPEVSQYLGNMRRIVNSTIIRRGCNCKVREIQTGCEEFDLDPRRIIFRSSYTGFDSPALGGNEEVDTCNGTVSQVSNITKFSPATYIVRRGFSSALSSKTQGQSQAPEWL